MFVLGHLGIGRAMLGRARWRLPAVAFLVGALLPDIIDKPLYYAHVARYVSGTRTFAHTGLFLCALALTAALRRSRVWNAVAIGVATHLVLDGVIDLFTSGASAEWIAFTWPFLHTQFGVSPFRSPLEQLHEVGVPAVLISEIVGFVLLVREYRVVKRRAALPEHPETRPDRVGGVGTIPVIERDE